MAGAEPAAAAQRGALCGQDALSPSAPPPRVGRAQILAGAVERWSPLAPGSVCSAGGVGTQVPAGGAELEVLSGLARPGPGPGREEGSARPPGPAADQVRTGGRVGPEDAGSRVGPRFEAGCWSLAPGGAAGFRPSVSTFPRTRGLQCPSGGQREVSEPRFPYL